MRLGTHSVPALAAMMLAACSPEPQGRDTAEFDRGYQDTLGQGGWCEGRRLQQQQDLKEDEARELEPE